MLSLSLKRVFCIAMLVTSLPAMSAGVWWSPAAEKILKELGVKNKRDAQNKVKKRCSQIDKMELENRSDVYTFAMAYRNCEILQLYVDAKPAKKATLGNYRFSKKSLKELPARMNLTSNEPGYTELQNKAERLLESWGATDHRHIVKHVSPYEMSIAWENTPDDEALRVSILGRGDFWGDGAESLAVLVQLGGVDPRDDFWTDVFVLRKKGSEKVFRTIFDWKKALPRCSSSRVNQIRREVQAFYGAKKFTQASKRGDQFLKECARGDVLDVPLAWLLSDLALADYKRGDKASCLKRLSTAEYLYYYAGGAKLEKAIETNKQLCSK